VTSKPLAIGQPAPWFKAAALDGNPRYTFDTTAGRWIVMLLLGSTASEEQRAALTLVAEHRSLFDDRQACFFGVTVDPQDAASGRIAQQLPGVRWFLDHDGKVSEAYGALERQGDTGRYTPHWLLLDPLLRVRDVAPLSDGGRILAGLRAAAAAEPCESGAAPVLIVPGVVSPEACRLLIEGYEANGGTDSGFMRDEDGITVLKVDHSFKRRSDWSLEEGELLASVRAQVGRSLVPMIERAFQFKVTRAERWLVARYDSSVGGYFRPHRDNTTAGTAHRRFACTINLNAEDYEGGDLCFPEFGSRTYRAPTGGAAVFSCSLLHEARPVTRGRRYALLPFLYDDEGARIREANLDRVSEEFRNYRSGLPAD
jgi:predicted 2-oxoglutarate/Fe(II)-dependent dioxygenase YbiX/peroxiredoxin